MRKLIWTVLVFVSLAVGFVSPTFLRSFGEKAAGWKLGFFRLADPGECLVWLAYSAAIGFTILCSGYVAKRIGPVTAFFGAWFLGAIALGVMFVAVSFAVWQGQYAPESISAAFGIWLGDRAFSIMNVVSALGASIFGLLIGAKLFLPIPEGTGGAPPISLNLGIIGKVKATLLPPWRRPKLAEMQ